jgi:NTP pyrophosphatase (non-canonical NTP hydrolase)
MFDLEKFQGEVSEWTRRNFGDQPAYRPLLGAVEEIGELAHAHLKEEQKIRGTAEELQALAKDAVGDVIVYLADYCGRRGWT